MAVPPGGGEQTEKRDPEIFSGLISWPWTAPVEAHVRRRRNGALSRCIPVSRVPPPPGLAEFRVATSTNECGVLRVQHEFPRVQGQSTNTYQHATNTSAERRCVWEGGPKRKKSEHPAKTSFETLVRDPLTPSCHPLVELGVRVAHALDRRATGTGPRTPERKRKKKSRREHHQRARAALGIARRVQTTPDENLQGTRTQLQGEGGGGGRLMAGACLICFSLPMTSS